MTQCGHRECECFEQLKTLIKEKDDKIEVLKDSIDELRTSIKEIGELQETRKSVDNSEPVKRVRKHDYTNRVFEFETHEVKGADWIAIERDNSSEDDATG